MSRLRTNLFGGASAIVVIIVILVIFGVLWAISSNFFYLFETVNEQEVGVRFKGGRIQEIVGPGVYSDFGMFVRMERVSSQAIPFLIEDPEIITKDKQRIGLVVSGDIFRPGLAQKDRLLELWAEYRGVYLDDSLAVSRVQDLAKQAMKVCVGDRNFDDNIIGKFKELDVWLVDSIIDTLLVIIEEIEIAKCQKALTSIQAVEIGFEYFPGEVVIDFSIGKMTRFHQGEDSLNNELFSFLIVGRCFMCHCFAKNPTGKNCYDCKYDAHMFFIVCRHHLEAVFPESLVR